MMAGKRRFENALQFVAGGATFYFWLTDQIDYAVLFGAVTVTAVMRPLAGAVTGIWTARLVAVFLSIVCAWIATLAWKSFHAQQWAFLGLYIVAFLANALGFCIVVLRIKLLHLQAKRLAAAQ